MKNDPHWLGTGLGQEKPREQTPEDEKQKQLAASLYGIQTWARFWREYAARTGLSREQQALLAILEHLERISQ